MTSNAVALLVSNIFWPAVLNSVAFWAVLDTICKKSVVGFGYTRT